MREGIAAFLERRESRTTKMPESEEIVLLDSVDAAVTLPYERAFRLVTDASHIIRLRQDPGRAV